MIISKNILYESPEQLEKALMALKPTTPDKCLIQIFSGILDVAVIERVLEAIRRLLPGTPVIGTTTAGEIMDGRNLDETMVLNITQFEETLVSSVLVTQNHDLDAAGRQIVNALNNDKTKALIVFGCGLKDGHTVNGSKLMETIQKGMPGIPVSGAQAGDNGRSEITYVFNQEGITDRGVVAAGLKSEVLEVVRTLNLSWIPIGKKMTITKAEGSRVYEIDHMPPKEIYKYYLGQEVADGLPLSAADFPLMIERDGMRQAIHATGVNHDGSFNFIHDFHVGEQMQFGYCHVGLLALGANETYEQMSAHDLQVAFVYTCVSRKWVLGEDVSIELSPVSEIACSAGFYSYGEYYHLENGSNLFLGQTMTVLGLSENANWKVMTSVKDRYKASESRQFKTMRVLHRLIERSTSEIEAINGQLSDLVMQDALTGLGNRRRFDHKIKSFVDQHMVSGKAMGIIMFDLDNFKAYNDTYGHVAGDGCLRGVGQVVSDGIKGTEHIGIRYGGEEFAILLSEVKEGETQALAERLRQDIQGLRIKHHASPTGYLTASFGALTVSLHVPIKPEDLIETCDALLYDAKVRGKNQVMDQKKTY